MYVCMYVVDKNCIKHSLWQFYILLLLFVYAGRWLRAVSDYSSLIV